MLNVACWNRFVIWIMNNPEWNRGNLAKCRLFLKDLVETVMMSQIRRRSLQPRLLASVQTEMDLCSVKPSQADDQPPAAVGNRTDLGRCHMCEKRDQVRGICCRFLCNDHSTEGSLCLTHDLSE